MANSSTGQTVWAPWTPIPQGTKQFLPSRHLQSSFVTNSVVSLRWQIQSEHPCYSFQGSEQSVHCSHGDDTLITITWEDGAGIAVKVCCCLWWESPAPESTSISYFWPFMSTTKSFLDIDFPQHECVEWSKTFGPLAQRKPQNYELFEGGHFSPSSVSSN